MAVTQTNDNGEGGVNVGAGPDLGINPAQYRNQILGLMTLAHCEAHLPNEDPIHGLSQLANVMGFNRHKFVQ